MFEAIRKKTRFFINLNHSRVLHDIFLKNRDLQKLVLDLNRQGQLHDSGVDSNDQIVGIYRRNSRGARGQLKAAGTPYTLDNTGKFYKSFKFDHVQNAVDLFRIEAEGQKSADTNLFDKFGVDILGLTVESKSILAVTLIPYIQRWILNNMP